VIVFPKGLLPGAVISIQTWGIRPIRTIPICTDGGFDDFGVFYTILCIDTQKMALLFRDKVFPMLIKE
jgi:hypothetical protein